MSLDIQIDRRNDLFEIRDQGPLPTCLSYATSTVHRVIKDLDNPLSAETLHYHATGADLTTGSGVEEVQQALRETGQPENRYCESVPFQDRQALSSWSPPADAPFYRSDSSQDTPSPSMVKEAILESKLPILGVSLTEEFYYPEPPWVFSAGQSQGLHAVVGVGLADYKGETVVLIRNSWGEDWANSGHAWLDNSFLENNLNDVLVLERGGSR